MLSLRELLAHTHSADSVPRWQAGGQGQDLGVSLGLSLREPEPRRWRLAQALQLQAALSNDWSRSAGEPARSFTAEGGPRAVHSGWPRHRD